MEHNPYDVHAEFWRDAYLFAMQAHHPDPAAAADEAFMAFDSRFGEVDETPKLGWVNHASGAGAERQYAVTYIDGGGVAHGAEMLAPPTADELVKQANEIPSPVPSVVVSDPPTEGLPAFEWKADDEALG